MHTLHTLHTKDDIHQAVSTAVENTEVFDIHTHLYGPSFGKLFSWGIDELLTYHYLVAELFRQAPPSLTYDKFWSLDKKEQADIIWEHLFLSSSPVSEACRGVLTFMQILGIDTENRNLAVARAWFESLSAEEYIDIVFEKARISNVVMTNNPFDDDERQVWETGAPRDERFQAALRLDDLLNTWPEASSRLKEWGYGVDEKLSKKTLGEVRRFLNDWIDRIKPLYMALSAPPDFRFPEESARGKLIAECVLPVSRERGMPLAMMLGAKRLINPPLRMAGDGIGRSELNVVEHLCREYPDNRFLVTVLSRECQHELVVLARKFRNLMIFGCWWFLNNPSIINEITRERLEMLGTSFIPQHSDARILDQLLYKWKHFRSLLAGILCDKYIDIFDAGWRPAQEEIERDVANLLNGNFTHFIEGE